MLYEVMTPRAGRGFHRDDVDLGAFNLVLHEGEGEAREVRAAAGAPDHYVGLLFAELLRITSYNVCYTKLLRLRSG